MKFKQFVFFLRIWNYGGPKTIISTRCLNNINCEQLNRDLLEAPWHVSDIFTDIDDK